MSEQNPVLHYQHPDDRRYTIEFLSDDPDDVKDAADRARERSGEEHISLKVRGENVRGSDVYLLYTWEQFRAGLPDFDDEESGEWMEEMFTEREAIVVSTLLDIFEAIIDEKEAQEEELLTYKGMHIGRIPDVMNQVEWKQSVPDVAAELLSEFILAHPMPNTNHRTAIGLADRYLTSIDPEFEMPDTGEEGEWYNWAADYIYDSKAILTLRRHLGLFRWANQYGYGTVARKEGLTIHFEDIDLDREGYHTYYTQQHQERSHEFIDTLFEEAGADHLHQETDPGKRVFVDRLQSE